jgi:hypothetical protein
MTKPQPKYRLVQLYPGMGRIEARETSNGLSHRFATHYLEGTRMVASCCIDGLTDDDARLAFPIFHDHAMTLVQDGRNVHSGEIRRLLQRGITTHLGKGRMGRVMNRSVKRELYPLPQDPQGPLLPLDAAPARPHNRIAAAAFDFNASAALGARASLAVAEAKDQVNLEPMAVLDAVRMVMTDDTLTQEQRDGAITALLAKATGNALERTPESIAAFALTSAMDKRTKKDA